MHSIPSLVVWAEIESMVHVPQPKQPVNNFKPVQESRQRALRAYCRYTGCGVKGLGQEMIAKGMVRASAGLLGFYWTDISH